MTPMENTFSVRSAGQTVTVTIGGRGKGDGASLGSRGRVRVGGGACCRGAIRDKLRGRRLRETL